MWKKIGCAAIAALILAGTPVQAQDRAEQQREDLTFFRNEYLPREHALTPEARAAAERTIDRLFAQAGALTDAQFFLGVAEIGAAAQNGHSIAAYESQAALPPTRLPLIVAWFEDAGLVILRALAPHQDLAGATILSIEGTPAREVMAGFRRFIGGAEARHITLSPGRMMPEGMLSAAGFDDGVEGISMRLRLTNGQEVNRVIANVPNAALGPPPPWPTRAWSPEPINGDDTTQWGLAISAENLPLYLRNGDANNRAIALPELDAVYLELKSNEAARDARQFAERAEAVLRQARPTNIIVDLRFNNGGDLTITGPFLQRLSSRLPEGGRVFVIVSRYTFSAGMASAAITMNAAGARATLVGEDVGDNPRFWSEGESVCAPNSRYCLRYTTGLFDMAQGCTGEPRCYGAQRRFNMVGSLTPTLRTPLTWEAYLAKRDPAMEAIRAALGL